MRSHLLFIIFYIPFTFSMEKLKTDRSAHSQLLAQAKIYGKTSKKQYPKKVLIYCEIPGCPRTYRSESSLLRHMKLNHKKNVVKVLEPADTSVIAPQIIVTTQQPIIVKEWDGPLAVALVRKINRSRSKYRDFCDLEKRISKYSLHDIQHSHTALPHPIFQKSAISHRVADVQIICEYCPHYKGQYSYKLHCLKNDSELYDFNHRSVARLPALQRD